MCPHLELQPPSSESLSASAVVVVVVMAVTSDSAMPVLTQAYDHPGPGRVFGKALLWVAR